MTFATIDDNKTNTVKTNKIKIFGAAVLSLVNDYRAERKDLRSFYHYHSEKDAILARAQRDVNRVWLG